MTQVSKDMKARAQAFGKEEDRQWRLPMPITNLRVELERGYEPHWWHYEPQWWSQSSWSHPAGGGHFSRDWAASYWDDDWAASSWDDDWWSGTRWHWSQEAYDAQYEAVLWPTFRAPPPPFRAPPPPVEEEETTVFEEGASVVEEEAPVVGEASALHQMD